MKIINKFLYLLSLRERKYAALLLTMMLIMAMLEMIGVFSIMPFMAVLVNPDLIDTNFILQSAFKKAQLLGVKSKEDFIFLLGILVFIILIFSIAFKFITYYAQLRFTTGRNYSLAKRLVEGYLHQPYSWFLNRNSADLGKIILSDVSIVIGKGMNPLLNVIKHSLVTCAMIVILILVDTKLTIIVGLTLGFSYWLIYFFTGNFLSKIGQKRLDVNRWMFTSINEAFGAAKEIKVSGLEHAYIKRFSKPAGSRAKVQALADVIGQSPRFALEAIAFGGMVLVALYLIAQSANFIEAVPVISLYAFAGYRLLPALQHIYASLTSLKFAGPTLDAMYNDLKNLQKINLQLNNEILPLKKEITLKNIYYNYPNTAKTVLKNINFSISARNIVGIVGATGSGKTTTIDIILGLLEVKKGTVEVDGKTIDKNNLKAWQRSIGYVPQHIFLADDTVAANIAFGVDEKKIDHEAVERSAKIAKLHEFVNNDLPQKYQTYIGERGVRLSGGQRQRIGIARALYHNPKVLILDEATSALDNNTEKQVMNEIKKLGENITIVMIAHRLSTVRECNSIMLLDKGELIGQGTFEELVKINDNFKAAAS